MLAVFASYPIIYPRGKMDARGRGAVCAPGPHISPEAKLLLLGTIPFSLRNITDLVSFAKFILRRRWASFIRVFPIKACCLKVDIKCCYKSLTLEER